ncbi:MAG TPA: cytochrome c biogenesis protein CcdA [Actinomycetota bacterium]|nr:cytochrome c biogenesis protein CcdA [Actinomycetota bacterium]
MELAPIALLAGLISITSPCILPLIPGYLSYISGVTSGSEGHRGRVLGASGLFVLGFASIFTALGASASLAGAVLLDALPVLIKVAGVFVIFMGLSMLGLLRLPFLYSEKRMDLRKIRSGPAGALPLGMAFAFGWTPCIGPILAGILTAAAATKTAGRGAALLAVYSLGMGIPFMLIALGYSRAGKTVSFLKRHTLKIERAGGILMVAMGVLLITGYWTRLFVPLIRFFSRSGWPPI